ncbi:hypothetical protein V2J09_008347 [Rumex salicifolius]
MYNALQKNCSICLAALDPGQGQAIFTAECSHSFHFHCITSNLKHGNQTCPICRANWKEIPSPPREVGPPSNLASWRQSNAYPTRMRRTPPHSSRQWSAPTEPDKFDDDESLSQPDQNEAASSNIPVTSTNDLKAITIKTYPEVSSVQRDKSLDSFTVLIHLEATIDNAVMDVPLVSQSSRTPIDLVTVLDISGSMEGSKLSLLKRAMGFVIQNLNPNDRLSVVSFSSTARRLFPLIRMTERGQQQALQAVDSLKASGGTNIAEGLRIGAKVMEERRAKNPVGSIILLSDGQDTFTCYAHNYSDGYATKLDYQLLLPFSLLGDDRFGSRIPVYTFGFGKDHDASLLHAISELSGGTFSFIETEETIQDAFAQCIGGLLSVVVQELQVEVECMHVNTCLLTIKAGSYATRIASDKRSGNVKLGDLYAEGQRDFLVSLNIPSVPSDNSTSLLQVKCSYKEPLTKETITLEVEQVKIARPEIVGNEAISIEVDRQRNRLQATEAMSEARIAAEQGSLEDATFVLENCRQILASTSSAKSKDQLSVDLDAELEEMQESLASRHVYEASGRAHILSGMSAHSWQRPTARAV